MYIKEIKKTKIGEMQLILFREKSDNRPRYWHYIYTAQLRNKIRWLILDGIWNDKKEAFDEYNQLVQILNFKKNGKQSVRTI